MASLVSFCKSLPLQFRVLAFDLVEYMKVVTRYYRSADFAKADFPLTVKGWVDNPFRVARLYVEQEGENPDALSSYTYGETPLSTFFQIAKEAGIQSGMKLIECGAGRGRVSLFAHHILGCEVTAYEKVPEFIRRLKRFPFLKVEEKSYLEGDFSQADVVYLYGTTLSEDEISRLGKQLETAKAGTLIITVSWYLNEVVTVPYFSILKVIEAVFPWGRTNVYIQVKKD